MGAVASAISKACAAKPENDCSKDDHPWDEGRLFLPLFPQEDHWNICLRGCLYLLGLSYFFVGVAIVSDIFMAAIETIVSRTKPVTLDWGEGLAVMKYNLRVSLWNGTVANLTLMALGSSAPEILLSVIEIISNKFKAGQLGPGTIVGSAAFNLLIISAACVYYVPKGETRRIEIYRVFVVTTIFSLFAYIWMIIVLEVFSPNVVQLWEALVTLFCFPLMVIIAWWADNEFFTCKGRKMRQSVYEQLVELRRIHEAMEHGGKKPPNADLVLYTSDGQINPQALVAYYKRIKAVAEVSDEEAASLLAMKLVDSRQHNRLWYRIGAVRQLMGGSKLTPVLNEKLQQVYEVLNEMQERESGEHAQTFHMGMGHEHRGTDVFRKKAVLEFESASIAVPENIGFITVPVIRKGREDNEVAVRVHTIEGTAKEITDYEPINVELIFEPFVFEQSVSIKIVDDDQWEPEEFFYVRLSLVDPSNQDATIGRIGTIELTILDDDRPGILTFTQRAMLVVDTANEVAIEVLRQDGCDGVVSVKYRTTPDKTIKPVKHPNQLDGKLTFQSGERSKNITIPLLGGGQPGNNETFVLDLVDPEGGATLGPIYSMKITVSKDENFQLEMTKVVERSNSVISNIEIATHVTYRQQIKSAFLVNGGSTETATIKDYVLHFITIFWKVLFAFIPPPHWCGGWLCFACSLLAVGMLTAIIGDMASIFGCVIGLDDTITAITLVALGTSLPDTFASVAAAIHDHNADNAIGNVTGSNSVNVFLGLGIPWTIAAIYHMFLHQQFVVPSGSLSFSVAIYTIVAMVAIAMLVMRRYLVVWGQAELGGPKVTKITTTLTFIALWVIYVGMSWLKAKDVITYNPFGNSTATTAHSTSTTTTTSNP